MLLRNDGTLPIDPATTAAIAVIGPNADDPRNLFGDYSYAAHVESLLEMRDADNVFHVPIPDDFDLDVDIVGDRTVFRAITAAFPTATVAHDAGLLGQRRRSRRLRRRGPAGRRIRRRRDGDGRQGGPHDRFDLRREPGSLVARPPGRAGGSRSAPSLATGTPVVLVLVAGRPCGSVEAHERCAAVVAAWLPGDEGAAAIADVLSGAVNPGGKLPVTFPRTAGHIPVYYRQKRSGGRSHWKGDYVDAAVSPLYPFGHGLSYTSFELTASSPTPATIGHDGEVTVDGDRRPTPVHATATRWCSSTPGTHGHR